MMDIVFSDTVFTIKVPSSKEDVFNNQAINLIDKRKLMRFLTYAVDYQEKPEMMEGTFQDCAILSLA